MGMFSSLFGSSGSDKADQMRQKAIDAFNSIKTPELSQLQVQLQNYVNAGQLTPEQAEATLVKSNAFNDVATDPSYVGAQKQALQQLQNISSSGGLTAVDKAQLQDINDNENQQRQSQDAAILSNAKERGVGGSGIETVNRLLSQQKASDVAARQGTDVAAQAQTRALQALQAAGQLGGQIESQQYGEQAQKAGAQNAIDQFNAQTSNATNLYNTQTANQAQAANLANKQNINNANTGTANQQTTQNAAAYQQLYNDALAKAQGVAGTYNGWASAADKDADQEQAGNLSLTSGLLKAGSQALGTAFAGPAGGAAASSAAPSVSNDGFSETDTKPYNQVPGYFHGGEVPNENKAIDETPDLEVAYNNFIKQFCYGGTVKMSDGGSVHVKAGKMNENKSMTKPELDAPQPKDINNLNLPQDFVGGGPVPGVAPVKGNNSMNDIVPAKLSPDEFVVNREDVKKIEQIQKDPIEVVLRRLKNPTDTGSSRG